MSKTTALVTGGSGFVGGHMVARLLREGYRVRTTVRSLAREEEVRATLGGPSKDDLAFFAADLLHDAGWDEATAGADFVVHVASPMAVGEYRKTDVIGPAREGTRRVLEAAKRAGVTRVVLTSSTVATLPTGSTTTPIDESVWTDLERKDVFDYPRAKTLAERDAWEFAGTHGLDLVTVLPSLILGPVLGRDYSASIDVVGLMLRGKMPMVPRIGMNIVDVRDLVDLHLRAMTTPAAAGERFIASGELLWFSEIAALLRAELGDEARRVSSRIAPDWLVRFGALFNPEMKQIAPSLGLRLAFSTAKAERLLGWHGRPAKASILDTARSLLDRGLA